jgi:hypothetical protein
MDTLIIRRIIMASLIPTEKEVEALLKERKIVTASISWSPSINGGWKLEARVLAPDTKELFSLRGMIGKDNYSFALLYKNYPIRKYTKHRSHKFLGVRITQPHKHKWNELSRDAEVYIPTDIDPNQNKNEQFLAFCKECNVEILGGYQIVSDI